MGLDTCAILKGPPCCVHCSWAVVCAVGGVMFTIVTGNPDHADVNVDVGILRSFLAWSSLEGRLMQVNDVHPRILPIYSLVDCFQKSSICHDILLML